MKKNWWETYNLKFEKNEGLKPEEKEILRSGIIENAARKKDMTPIRSFAVLVRDEREKVLGGADGVSIYGNLYVNLLWVSEELRGLGIGTKIMEQAEEIAHERNCRFITLTTMDFEALPFYQKLGFHIEFERTGYDKDSTMYYLKKLLNPSCRAANGIDSLKRPIA